MEAQEAAEARGTVPVVMDSDGRLPDCALCLSVSMALTPSACRYASSEAIAARSSGPLSRAVVTARLTSS